MLTIGFQHVKDHPEHRTLLGFQFETVYFQWTVLHYRHSCSPFLFCKVLQPVIKYLRAQGERIVLYVDDFLLLAQQNFINEH